MINSLSIEELFWTGIDEGRISFSFEGLPKSVHFTISWKNDNNINLHISKNTGDGEDKPKIVIASWNKELAVKIISYMPSLVMGKLFERISFKVYSRRSRKNIRLIYFDEIENHKSIKNIERDATKIFKQNSTVKRKKLSIKATIEKDFIPFTVSATMKALLLNNLRPLTSNSFASRIFRCGMIFLGNRSFLFISHNDKCFILKRKRTIQELLRFFMKPELVDELANEINRALVQIQDAKTFADTILHNKPYQLYSE